MQTSLGYHDGLCWGPANPLPQLLSSFQTNGGRPWTSAQSSPYSNLHSICQANSQREYPPPTYQSRNAPTVNEHHHPILTWSPQDCRAIQGSMLVLSLHLMAISILFPQKKGGGLWSWSRLYVSHPSAHSMYLRLWRGAQASREATLSFCPSPSQPIRTLIQAYPDVMHLFFSVTEVLFSLDIAQHFPTFLFNRCPLPPAFSLTREGKDSSIIPRQCPATIFSIFFPLHLLPILCIPNFFLLCIHPTSLHSVSSLPQASMKNLFLNHIIL